MKKAIVLTVSIFSLFLGVNAQDLSRAVSYKAEEPMLVKYVETEGNYLVFSVQITAFNNLQSTFKIDDAIEGELYSSKFQLVSKVQKVKIEKRENQVLDFKLVSAGKTYSQSFTTYNGVVESDKEDKSVVRL